LLHDGVGVHVRRKAFQTALGVSYDQVLSEAHSYVAGGSWKFG